MRDVLTVVGRHSSRALRWVGPVLVVVLIVLVFVSATGTRPSRAATSAVRTGTFHYVADGSSAHTLIATYRTRERARPWILEVHGGSWVRGSTADMIEDTRIFSAHGYAVFNMSYRLFGAGDTTYADQKADVVSALAWIRRHARHFGVDARRGALYGTSAGGNLVLRVGLAPNSGVKAIIGDVPISQPERIAYDAMRVRGYDPTNHHVHKLYGIETRMMGCAWTPDADPTTPGCRGRWQDFSPESQRIGAASPPVLIYTGSLDPFDTYLQARSFALAEKRQGLAVQVVNDPGMNHTQDTFYAHTAPGLAFLGAHV